MTGDKKRFNVYWDLDPVKGKDKRYWRKWRRNNENNRQKRAFEEYQKGDATTN